jgi:hypothetical protein
VCSARGSEALPCWHNPSPSTTGGPATFAGHMHALYAEGEGFEPPGDGLGSAPAVFKAITKTAVTWEDVPSAAAWTTH